MHRRGARDALGLFCLAALVSGTVAAICITTFLAFLWAGEGSDGGEFAPRLWRWIVLDQRITQAITLCTVSLRFVISAHATICTSLMSAVVLETCGIPLAKAAEVSVMRGVNSGPPQLVWLLMRHLAVNSALFLKLLMVTSLVTSITAQFSSTILVADLGYASIVGNQINITTMLGITPSEQPLLGTNPFYLGPAPVLFGEISTGTSPLPTDKGVSDTGAVKRLFPPISQDAMSTLRRYQGGLVALYSRFVCLPPTFDDLEVQQGAGTRVSVMGSLEFAASFANTEVDFDTSCGKINTCFPPSVAFNCSYQTGATKKNLGNITAL